MRQSFFFKGYYVSSGISAHSCGLPALAPTDPFSRRAGLAGLCTKAFAKRCECNELLACYEHGARYSSCSMNRKGSKLAELKRHSHQHLARVCPSEKSQYAIWQVFKTIHETGAVRNLTLAQPK